jgi:hypothetical protein
MRAWLKEFGPSTFRAWDFWAALGVGVVSAVLTLDHAVRASAPTVLLASAGINVALTATVLAALAIFTALFDSSYRRVLEAAGGVREALMPYTTTAFVAGLGTVVALVSALASPYFGKWVEAAAVGVAMLLTAWTVAGFASLVEQTHFHATQRAKLLKGADDAEEIIAARLPTSSR